MSRSTPTVTTVGHWIDGAAIPAGVIDTIDVVNPANEEVVARVPAGTRLDVDRAVAAARAALEGWSATPVAQRMLLVQAISDGVRERAADIGASITSEMGAPTNLAKLVHAELPAMFMASFVELTGEFVWEEEIANSLVVKEPVGVVGAITPWNYPLHQVVAKIAPALLTGNTVVLKPSEVAPRSAVMLAEIAAHAGLPAGVLNVVHGTGPVVGEAIAEHPGVDMISFTGSSTAGKRVTVVAAETVKRVVLELGGKSASILLDSADLDSAVPAALSGAWQNAGQTCTAWTRMLVPAANHDDVIDRLTAAASAFTVGDPTDESTMIGPLASQSQRRRVNAYIEQGLASPAKLALGGLGPVPGVETGAYVNPTIFGNVDPDSSIAQEEIFGPVLSVIPYSTEDDAVAIANNSRYGLSGAVFGDEEHAVAVARRIRTGQVDINGIKFNMLAPFGGYKQSGNGSRELGRYGLDEFVEIKAIQR